MPLRTVSALAIPVVLLGTLVASTGWPGSAPAARGWVRTRSGTADVRYVVSPAGNEARYRVREQLAGFDLPNDAVGITSQVSGVVSFTVTGRLVPEESRIVVDVRGLKSDKERRDGYVQRRLLETETFPSVELLPTEIRSLRGAIPPSGRRSFEVLANFTVRGVTRPTLWHVTADFRGPRATGRATTAFTFTDFALTQPKVPVVLSVADTIRLEYDFDLTREGR